MSRRALFLAASLLILLATACSNERSAGNSYETENKVTARILPVDSILPLDTPILGGTTVSTLRFDVANFDFTQPDSLGQSISVERLDSTPIPFQIVFWDRRAALGRLKVRIDSGLRASHSSLVLRWNQNLASRSDSGSVW